MTERAATAPAKNDTRDPDGITIRRIATEAEYQECVRIQHEVWGERYSGAVPSVIFSLAQRLSGVVAGAFDADDRLIGFVFGMTGLIDGELAHWSDLLAVRPEARDRGIGRRLKLYQRDCLRAIGIRTMFWTYDPLVARNAYLNIVRLGAVPVEYAIDFYGTDTGSELHGALGTDRLIVSWDLTSDPVPLADRASPGATDAECGPYIVNPSRGDGPPLLLDLPGDAEVRIEIPPDIHSLGEHALEIADAWRATTRRAFSWYLDHGYRIVGFTAFPDSGRCFYTLSVTEN